jgi:chorismate mutase
MAIRGVRGATTVPDDGPQAIFRATQELLKEIMGQNDGMRTEDIASTFFTLTEDLSSAYPAQAARQMGWEEVPMMCAREIPVPDGLPRIIRVLIHWNTEVPQSRIRHVYLHDAAQLRPDLTPAQQQV